MTIQIDQNYVTDVLNEVMLRIEKQMLVPATYTMKKVSEMETQVHVFLHGSGGSHFSNVEFLFEHIGENGEKLRQINAISDYLIGFFIDAMKKEREAEAIQEVVGNLDFVYEHKVHATVWYDEEKEQDMISISPVTNPIEIVLTAAQLEHEYNNRFINEEEIDILADLADLLKTLSQEGLEKASEFARSLNRNIVVK